MLSPAERSASIAGTAAVRQVAYLTVWTQGAARTFQRHIFTGQSVQGTEVRTLHDAPRAEATGFATHTPSACLSTASIRQAYRAIAAVGSGGTLGRAGADPALADLAATAVRSVRLRLALALLALLAGTTLLAFLLAFLGVAIGKVERPEYTPESDGERRATRRTSGQHAGERIEAGTVHGQLLQ